MRKLVVEGILGEINQLFEMPKGCSALQGQHNWNVAQSPYGPLSIVGVPFVSAINILLIKQSDFEGVN